MPTHSVFLVFVTLFASAVGAQEADLKNFPQSAVKCVWGTFVAMQTVGDLCFPDDDKDFRSALNEAVERMDRFILENSQTSRSEIDAYKARVSANLDQRPYLVCINERGIRRYGFLEHYKHWRSKGILFIQEETAKILSSPHAPAGGCY